MLSWIREKFGTVVIVGIIGFIAFVFIFSGVFSPKATRGLHEGAVAGKVNGEPISIGEFNRALSQRLEFFKAFAGGGRISEEQMKAFRVREGVFESLVRRKLMLQEAERQGLLASDEEVKQKIREIPAFQKNGKFDVASYQQALAANSYTPSGFERLIREDLSVQRWEEYFRDRVRVSEDEIRRQYQLTENKRTVKYVLLNQETGRKAVTVAPADVETFLKDPQKLNIAKGQYEAKKAGPYKGKSFDDVKGQIAREILASEKVEEVRKANEKLADQVAPLMAAAKASDAKLNALLKPYGTEVKTFPGVSQARPAVPGFGDSPELATDLFASASPIDAAKGGKAKKYVSGPNVLVALVVEAQQADLAKLDAQRDQVIKQIVSRKERELFEAWMKGLTDKAKVDTNPSVVGGEA